MRRFRSDGVEGQLNEVADGHELRNAMEVEPLRAYPPHTGAFLTHWAAIERATEEDVIKVRQPGAVQPAPVEMYYEDTLEAAKALANMARHHCETGYPSYASAKAQASMALTALLPYLPRREQDQ